MRHLCGNVYITIFSPQISLTVNKQYKIIIFSFLDYIADCVDEFLTEQNLSDQETDLYLGYTFSFPVLQSKVKYKSIQLEKKVYRSRNNELFVCSDQSRHPQVLD